MIERVAYSPLRKASSNAGSTDHRDRCQLSASEPGTFDLRSRCQELSYICYRLCRPCAWLDGQLVITRDNHCDDPYLYRHHGRSDAVYSRRQKRDSAMLAVSEDRGAAQLMGVNVNATICHDLCDRFRTGSNRRTFFSAQTYPSLTPYTGAMPGIKAFVAAVFGGIGSIPGALIGGILLGVIEILGKAYISSQVADAICIRRPDRSASCKTYRTARQEDPGESVRWW